MVENLPGVFSPYIFRQACLISADSDQTTSGPEVIKLFSCSTQLSMKFVLLINLKLLTILNSFLLNIAQNENFTANKYENANCSWLFHIYKQRNFHAQLS